MQNIANARQAMVDSQLRTSGVLDWRVLDAMGAIPRERFVPDVRRGLAYAETAHALDGNGHVLAPPAVFGKLVQLADIKPSDVILDVGCGTGYSSAVLASIGSAVVGIEDDKVLVARANDILADLEISNAAVLCGPLEKGVAKEAPFDVILIEGQVDEVPDSLLKQLRDGGRLVAVVGNGAAAVARIFVKSLGAVAVRTEFNATLPPLKAMKIPENFVL